MKDKQKVRQIENKVNFVANFAKTRNLNGVRYAIYPCVLLVEGVHHGIGTDPVYYSQNTLRASANYWNNVPVTVGHPVVNGQHVLCNHDGTVRQRFQVGHVSNSRFEDNKLKGDIWINTALAEEKSPDLIEFLESGGELEVSTGLLAGEDGVSGNWNGETYTASILEIIPDHLALLPGSTGACSWNDGCGVRVNGQDKKHTPIFCELEMREKVEKIHQYVDSLDKYNEQEESHDVINFVRAIYGNYFIYEEILRDGTTALFKQEYSFTDNELQTESAPVAVSENISYKTKTNEGDVMEKKDGTCCPEKVNALITNKNNAFTEDDKTWLEGLNEAQLEKLVTNTEPVVEEKAPEVEKETTPVQNSVSDQIANFLKEAPAPIAAFINEGMRTLDEKRDVLITKITNHENSKFSKEQLTGMSTEMLEGIASMVPVAKPEPEPVQNYGLGFPAVVNNNAEEVEPYVPATLSGALNAKK